MKAIRTTLKDLEAQQEQLGRLLIVTRFCRGAIAEALAAAQLQQATGRLVVHFSQGVPGDVEFEAKVKC